ncbi:hypothetical protein HYW18_00340 [Candidatus Uhrbacteria bacterium]|nr:hypothetical protein [Candidatus Uhrbacteria bacterium]
MKFLASIFLLFILFAPQTHAAYLTQPSRWLDVYNGYGTNLFENGTWSLVPKASVEPSETHASLVLAKYPLSEPYVFRTTMTPVRQLRTGSPPNPWETGWLLFDYKPDGRFKYLILKPDGYGVEIGEYLGPGEQNFLYTSRVGDLSFPIGQSYDVTLVVRSSRIFVFVNGQEVARYAMSENDILDTTGRVGLYTEDAEVLFQDIFAQRLTSR